MDLYPLVLLACPIGMGLMMWMMMRAGSDGSQTSRDREIADLRSEIEDLRTVQRSNLDQPQPERQIGQ